VVEVVDVQVTILAPEEVYQAVLAALIPVVGAVADRIQAQV
jgi:hypothetical protein